MQTEEFKIYSQRVTDYIVNYMQTIQSRPVTPNVEPGFMKELIPASAPRSPESMEEILSDVESKIMPGVTHWQHPGFFAYFPSGNSYPSILADMISDAIGCIGFSWAASPSCTELETIMLDWLAKMIGLPIHFLYHNPKSIGGGVLQGSASECILVSMLTARNRALEKLKTQYPEECPGVLLYKLVAYCSNQAHCSMSKAAQICFINLRSLDTDDMYSLRGPELEKAIEEDIAQGLIPFMVLGTLGTTSVCSFDNIYEIGQICSPLNLWFHIDAAYAGSAFVCPELRKYLKGVEYADSFNMNPNKWMLTNFDCSAYWVKDRNILINTMNENPTYLQHKNSSSEDAIDYRHWGISLSRRFRSLKLWFVIRRYGITGIQKYIRNHIRLAKMFEKMVMKDGRFEVIGQANLGLVCFRLKQSNDVNKQLLDELNDSGKIHMVPATLRDKFVLRFAICRENAGKGEIYEAWNLIRHTSTLLLLRMYRVETLESKMEPNVEDFKKLISSVQLTPVPTFYKIAYMCGLGRLLIDKFLPHNNLNVISPANVNNNALRCLETVDFLGKSDVQKITLLQSLFKTFNIIQTSTPFIRPSNWSKSNYEPTVDGNNNQTNNKVCVNRSAGKKLTPEISENVKHASETNDQNLEKSGEETMNLKTLYEGILLKKQRRSITDQSKTYNPCVGNVTVNVDRHDYLHNRRYFRAASVY